MISTRRTRTTAEAAYRAGDALLVLLGLAAGRAAATEPDAEGAKPFEAKIWPILTGRLSPGSWATCGLSGRLVP